MVFKLYAWTELRDRSLLETLVDYYRGPPGNAGVPWQAFVDQGKLPVNDLKAWKLRLNVKYSSTDFDGTTSLAAALKSVRAIREFDRDDFVRRALRALGWGQTAPAAVGEKTPMISRKPIGGIAQSTEIGVDYGEAIH